MKRPLTLLKKASETLFFAVQFAILALAPSTTMLNRSAYAQTQAQAAKSTADMCKGYSGATIGTSLDLAELPAHCQTWEGSRKAKKTASTLFGVYTGIFATCMIAGILCPAAEPTTQALARAFAVACGASGFAGSLTASTLTSQLSSDLSSGLRTFNSVMNAADTTWQSLNGISQISGNGGLIKGKNGQGCANAYISAGFAAANMVRYKITRNESNASERAASDRVASTYKNWEQNQKQISAQRRVGYTMNNDGYETPGTGSRTSAGGAVGGSADETNDPIKLAAQYEPGLNLAPLSDPKFQDAFRKMMGMSFDQFATASSQSGSDGALSALQSRGVLSSNGADKLKGAFKQVEDDMLAARAAEDVPGGKLAAGGARDIAASDTGMQDMQAMFKQLSAGMGGEGTPEEKAMKELEIAQFGQAAIQSPQALERSREVSLFQRVGYRYWKNRANLDSTP